MPEIYRGDGPSGLEEGRIIKKYKPAGILAWRFFSSLKLAITLMLFW
jgi:hypothetical protein